MLSFAIITALLLCVAAIGTLSFIMLRWHRRSTEESWKHMMELRHRGLDTVPAFLAAVAADVVKAETAAGTALRTANQEDHRSPVHQALRRMAAAADEATEATTPETAGIADDELARSLSLVYEAAEKDPLFTAGSASRHTSCELDRAEGAVAQHQRIYNNQVTSYNNALMAIPAMFFAHRLGFVPAEKYESKVAARRAQQEAQLYAQKDSLIDAASASAPMVFWAVSTAEAVIEDKPTEKPVEPIDPDHPYGTWPN